LTEKAEPKRRNAETVAAPATHNYFTDVETALGIWVNGGLTVVFAAAFAGQRRTRSALDSRFAFDQRKFNHLTP
jgi:hypothetical protein